MERAGPLGRNQGGYRGETLDIKAVLDHFSSAAREHGWALEDIWVNPGLSLSAAQRVKVEPKPGSTDPDFVPELMRPAHGASAPQRRRVYISAGIHGDEPAGPQALLRLVQEDRWSPDLDLWVCPCLNPSGFSLNHRQNAKGIDLNRQYLNPTADETAAHIRWLQRQPHFDLCLCLHEDWESSGFYLYELNPDNRPSLAEAMIDAVKTICPIDHSEIIEGRPARAGIIRPNLDPRTRPQWPEAFYLLTHHTRLSYTLEAPSDFPLAVRVTALVAAVQAVLESVSKEPRKALPKPPVKEGQPVRMEPESQR